MEKYDSEKTGNPGFEDYDWPMDSVECGSLLPLSPASLLAPLEGKKGTFYLLDEYNVPFLHH